MTDLKELLGQMDQIGIVVKDLEKIKKHMKEIYGVEPRSEEQETYKGDHIFRGEPCDYSSRIVYYNLYDVEIEYSQPLEGKCPGQEHLEEHGEGMHHIRYNVMDYDAVAAYFKDNYNLEPYYYGGGEIYGGLKFAYFDTREILGYIIEVLNMKGVAATNPGLIENIRAQK